MTRKRGIMPEALARSALDQISALDLADKVTFHVMGEPLLHPKLFEILDYAASKNIPVGLTTNGALLRPKVIQELARHNLYQIDISLQTPDKESFNATRCTNMDFGEYRDNLLNLLGACAAKASPPIFKIRIMTTRFARKMRERLNIQNFMPDSETLRTTILEWSALVYNALGVDFAREEFERRIKKISIYGWNVIEISPRVFIETYVLTDWGNAFAGDSVIESRRGYCFGMRDHFAILYSGEVVLCCLDFDGKTALGNLNDSSLLDVLKSPALSSIMKGFQSGKLVHKYCRQCLGSGSRLGSWVKPAASVVGLKFLKPFFYRKYKLYD
jgi:MoaA/NifB/PqqE/SkfB family radical SAM enzyme